MSAKLEPRMTDSPPFTIEIQPDSPEGQPPQKKPGETLPRRNIKYKDHLLVRPRDDTSINTLFDFVKRAVAKFGDQPCMGWRDLVKIHNETTYTKKVVDGVEQQVPKEWTYYELTPYKYITYREYEKLALQVGSGLRKLGLDKGDKVHVYAATSARWLAIMHATASQSMPIVTAYETLGEDGLRQSISATKVRAVFTDAPLLKRLGKCLDNSKVEFVIYNDDRVMDKKDVAAFKKTYPSIHVVSFEELRALGEEYPTEPVLPDREDLCCIMYTSGSTGTPKGVCLKHKNIVAAVAGPDSIVGDHIGTSDTVIAYLPLAHIFEMVFETTCLFWGARMGFGHPRTISDASVRNCAGDIRELRPTIMVGVPQVWETIMKGITQRVQKSGKLKSTIFWSAFNMKCFLQSAGLPGSGLIDSLIFQPVAEATGGRLRLCMSGAGPIAKPTQQFISMTLCMMINGYGMTETCAMAGVTDPRHWTLDAVGDIPGCIEMKLVDFADGGYLTSHNPPRGEIWIRGESLMSEYFEDPDETAKVLTEDGWYATGDIGEFDKNGHLRVIDRKKSLVKSLNGEYIALEKLESIYRTANSVANICIYAAPDRARPMAIVVPTDHAASEAGDSDLTLRTTILAELQSTGRKHRLASFEIVETVVTSDEPWTPENGLVTASNKLNRRKINDRFAKDIKEAYAQIK